MFGIESGKLKIENYSIPGLIMIQSQLCMSELEERQKNVPEVSFCHPL